MADSRKGAAANSSICIAVQAEKDGSLDAMCDGKLCWSGGTLNTWRSGDDGRPVTERLQVRF
jgi:hypothetical protein